MGSKQDPSVVIQPTMLPLSKWDIPWIHGALSGHRDERVSEYRSLAKAFKDFADSKTEDDISTITDLIFVLRNLHQSVAGINEDHSALIAAVLRCPWSSVSVEAHDDFSTFVMALLSAQPSYLDTTVRSLVRHLRILPKNFSIEKNTYRLHLLGEDINSHFNRLLDLVLWIVRMFPLSISQLLKYLGELAPFKSRTEDEHLLYVFSILQLHRRLTTNRAALLSLLVEHLSKIDAEGSSEQSLIEESDSEDEEMEEGKTKSSWVMDQPVSERLDLMMLLIFEHIESLKNAPDSPIITRQLYEDLQLAFDSLVFKSHGLSHVQFIWFYLASSQESIGEDFLRRIWQKAMSPNLPPILRQYGICYVGSYLARAQFAPIRVVIRHLDLMIAWIHEYIKENDDDFNPLEATKTHKVFYAVCQNAFYLLTFRHTEIFDQKKGKLWFRALNFDRIILSKLNPLKYVLKVVVNLFASVMMELKLLYCNHIIERNNRMSIFGGSGEESQDAEEENPLSSFFPFDPYRLKRSKRFITPFYRNYDEPLQAAAALDDDALNFRGLIADENSGSSSGSGANDTLPNMVEKFGKPERKSRKRQLSDNCS